MRKFGNIYQTSEMLNDKHLTSFVAVSLSFLLINILLIMSL